MGLSFARGCRARSFVRDATRTGRRAARVVRRLRAAVPAQAPASSGPLSGTRAGPLGLCHLNYSDLQTASAPSTPVGVSTV